MILTIHQPEHLPWLGFYNKMSTADEFVILDGVQFRKNYFQNRNQIMGTNGKQWITVPVELSGHSSERICDIKIANSKNPKWKEKYLRTIEFSYKKHPFFDNIYPEFSQIIMNGNELLSDLNIEIIRFFCDKLAIHPKFTQSSKMEATGLKNDLILNLCKEMNADTYVAGPSGRDYLKLEDFKKAGIEVVFNDFVHPSYNQKGVNNFVPYLSVLDLLMNVSEEMAREVVCGTKFWNYE